jgi:hypothetical protein
MRFRRRVNVMPAVKAPIVKYEPETADQASGLLGEHKTAKSVSQPRTCRFSTIILGIAPMTKA